MPGMGGASIPYSRDTGCPILSNNSLARSLSHYPVALGTRNHATPAFSGS